MADTLKVETAVPTGTGRRRGLFYGWYIVAAAAAINVYGAGVWFYGFPIFFKVLLDEFGWSAAAGAAVISLSRLEGGLEGPIIGWAIDKFGPRRNGRHWRRDSRHRLLPDERGRTRQHRPDSSQRIRGLRASLRGLDVHRIQHRLRPRQPGRRQRVVQPQTIEGLRALLAGREAAASRCSRSAG